MILMNIKFILLVDLMRRDRKQLNVMEISDEAKNPKRKREPSLTSREVK